MRRVSRIPFATVRQSLVDLPSWLPGAEARPRRSVPVEHEPLPSVPAIRESEMPRVPSLRASFSLEPSESAALLLNLRSVPVPRPSLPVMSQVPSVDPALANAFEQAVSALVAERQRLLTEAEPRLAELATLIASRVLARELSVGPDVVHGLVREGVAALGAQGRVRVRLGRVFFDAWESSALAPAASFDVDVAVDPSLSDYGCVIESDLGRVDESVQARFDRLLRALADSESAG